MGTSGHKIQVFVKRELTDYLVSSFCIKFALRMHEATKTLLREIALNPFPVVSIKNKAKSKLCVKRKKRRAAASLSSLPTELRMRIFSYVTMGAFVKVVAFRDGLDDAVDFKRRGMS